MKTIEIGSAVSKPGELVYGFFDHHVLPTGGVERLPVMIAQGLQDGPCFWFTANIHGNELTGVPALHETITAELAKQLRGTVVAIPSLNPAGLRTGTRRAYYDDRDPNRTFPGSRQSSGDPLKDAEDTRIPTPFEEAHARLFEHIAATADYLIDLHCYTIQATPFSIRDRVMFHGESDKAEAEKLAIRTDEMIKAFGLPVVNEYVAARFFHENLHRSTSAAALYQAKVPAFTVELGANSFVPNDALEAAKQGILNVLRWAEMIPGKPEPLTMVANPNLGFNTTRETLPKSSCSGLVRYHVKPGQIVQEGDLLATVRDIFGRELAQIRAPQTAWVMSLSHGLIVYQGQAVVNMAIRDDSPLFQQYPENIA